MTLHELRKSYEELRQSWTRGRITDAQYQQSIRRLRYQDRAGVWYQIDPRDGGLLRWTGQQWERSLEGGQTGARSSDQGMSGDVPRQFFPLLGRIIRLTLQTFFRRIPMTLVYAVLYTLILWGVYFGIMAFKNDGFNGASAFDQALGWGGGDTIQLMAGLNGGIFIAVVITLMVGVYSVVRRQGLSGAIAGLMRMPGEIRRYFANAGELALAGLVSGTGVGLVIGSVVSGYTSIALALGVGALIVSTGGQTIALLVRSSWESTYSMVRGGTGGSTFNKYTGYVAMMGTSLGFVLRIYINTWTTSVVLGVVLLAIAMFLSSGKGRAAGHVMLYILGAYLLLDWVTELSVVMADDRGPAELNMKFSEWYKSEHGKIISKIARNQATATGLSASLLTTLTRSMTNVLQSGMPGGTQYDEEGQRKWESYEERPRTTWSGEDKIVSGDGAIKWLKDNGMMDKDGKLNNKFREWYQRLPGDTRPTDLEGVAGDIDVEGKQPQGKNITIVYREKPPGPGKGQSPPPGKTPEPPPGKTPVPPPGKTPVPPPGKTPVPPPGKTPVPPPGKTPVPPPGKTPVPPPGKTPVPPPGKTPVPPPGKTPVPPPGKTPVPPPGKTPVPPPGKTPVPPPGKTPVPPPGKTPVPPPPPVKTPTPPPPMPSPAPVWPPGTPDKPMELDEEIEEYNSDLEFKRKIDEIVKNKIKEGYFVRNADWFRKVWNNFMFGALAPGRYIELIGGYKGGQCGEFCDWGKGWVYKTVRDSYGDAAIITDITMNEKGWRNHAATRVILPDGRRVVIDFWESIHKGYSCIYTEKQWIDKYTKSVGGPVTRSDLEKELKTYVEQLGMEEGTKWYLQSSPKKPYINTLVKSYTRDPW